MKNRSGVVLLLVLVMTAILAVIAYVGIPIPQKSASSATSSPSSSASASPSASSTASASPSASSTVSASPSASSTVSASPSASSTVSASPSASSTITASSSASASSPASPAPSPKASVPVTRYLSVRNIQEGLDLKGGVSITYQAVDKDGKPLDASVADMNSANTMIRKRLDEQQYTDAETTISNGNRINVDIPGVKDAEQAIKTIGATAQLKFTDESGKTLVEGKDVVQAIRTTQNSSTGVGQTVVQLTFNADGKAKFAAGTGANVGKRILIWMDKNIISAPVVNQKINSDTCIIEGGFDNKTADDLANLIRSGSLPFNLKVINQTSVGARLGQDAISTSLKAAVIGLTLVLIFMLVIYKGLGVAADIALIMYIALELIMLSAFRITLTLPGVAGIILSIGMAVDANVIIFERIKEEMRVGKSARVAAKSGFSRALPAILDGNITTLIAAIILFWLGSGTIKGFAQTLMMGIILSMFTALIITNSILKSFIGLGLTDAKYYGVKKKEEELK